MTIVWTRLALSDLEHVREYIAKDKPEAAQSTIERIANSIEQLALYPDLGRSGRINGTRELIVAGTPYIVPYRIKKSRIEILSILHSARRWPG